MHNLIAKGRRINILSGVVLIAATLATGLVVFVVMKNHTEDLLAKGMVLSLQTRADQFQFEIYDADSLAHRFAGRIDVARQLRVLRSEPGNTHARSQLRNIAKNLLSDGIERVEFRLPRRSRPILSVGDVVQEGLSVPLSAGLVGQLEWDQGFVLKTTIPVTADGQNLGSVTVLSRHPELDTFVMSSTGLGKTSEIVICGDIRSDNKFMKCFPSQLSGHVFPHQARVVNGAPLPMSYALDRKSGVVYAHDYRHEEVVAAYGPIGNLGLGMVLKIDTSELFAPILEQGKFVAAAIVLIVLLGMAVLRWLVAPLVAQVLRSEKDTRDTNFLLRDSETRTRAVLDNVDEGIITVSEDGLIQSANGAIEGMFGYRDEQLTGKGITLLFRHHDPDLTNRALLRLLLDADDPPLEQFGLEVTGIRRDGSLFPAGLKVSEMTLKEGRVYIGALRDLTDYKAKEAKILHLANHDALTGLPNRNLLQDRIEQAILHGQRHGSHVAVLFIDLDNFKTINDSLGHDVGDMLLQTVSRRISDCVREKDTVARQGGDEFIVVITELHDPQDAGVVCTNILNALSIPYNIGNRELHSNASIGIAVFPEDGRDVDALLKHSDVAMYHAKSTGRNNFQFYAPEMNERAIERLMIESYLRHAVEYNELHVEYQPIVSVGENQRLAVEALLRWRHPTLGEVAPTTFIPIAEEAGLIVELGDWVLRQACLQMRAWEEEGFAVDRMVVNISPRQFRQKNLAQSIVDVLHETGVKGEQIGLEITETVIVDNPEFAIITLQELREFGIEISLDDFGTGYSSFGILKRFPIDKLKVDRTFVRDIAKDEADASVVAGIIAMAHSLGIRVVAEGVETREQLEFIRSNHCDEYQGYFYSRPRLPDELSAPASPDRADQSGA
jgi:diguanylate cyclase (GGDEF)-like protein/PAS domain S-box-containing protein